MKYIVYLTTFLLFSTAVAQNPTILQGNYISNVFGQSNFVKNPNAQTGVTNVTLTTATATRSTTTPLVATTEWNVTITSANGTAVWATRTFDAGMKNQNCEARFSYRGFQATSKAQIKQGANVVAELTLTPSATDPRIASINFPCGDLSSATTFVITDTATLGGVNEIGGIYVGLATNQANVAQAEVVVVAARGATTQSIPHNSATTVIFDDEQKDTDNGYDSSTGIFTVKKSGIYKVETQVSINANSCGVGGQFQIQLFKNTNEISRAYNNSADTGSYARWVTNSFSFDATTGDTIYAKFYQNCGSPVLVSNLVGTSAQSSIKITRFPSSSELVVTPETQNVFGGVTYNANTDFVGFSTSDYTKVTDNNFGLRTFVGNATVASSACGLATNDFGFCLQNVPPGTYIIGGNVQVGVTETTDKTWCNYHVRVNGSGFSTVNAISVIPHTYAWNEFSPIGTGIIKIDSHQSYVGVHLTYNKETLANGCTVRSNTSGADGAWPSLYIHPIDNASNSALYVQGPVKAAATGTAIPAGYVGEVIQSTQTGTTALSTSNAYYTSEPVTLTPGVWSCFGNHFLYYGGTAPTGFTRFQAGICSGVNCAPANTDFQVSPGASAWGTTDGSNFGQSLITHAFFNVTTSTTYYLSMLTKYTALNNMVIDNNSSVLKCIRLN